MIVQFAILILLLVHFAIKSTKYHTTIDALPGPLNLPFIGNVWLVLFQTPETCFKLIRELNKKYFPAWRVWLGYECIISLQTPYDIQQVLNDSAQLEKADIYRYLKPWLRNGLDTSEGQLWHSRRKLITGSFHYNMLKKFFHIFVSNAEQLVEELKSECDKKHTDVTICIPRTTLSIICETAMGFKLDTSNEEQMEYKESIEKIIKICFDRMTKPWLHYDLFYPLFPTYWKQKRLLKIIHTFTARIVDERKRTFVKELVLKEVADEDTHFKPKHRLALLDLLLSADGEEIDEEGIREEVDSFMFGGLDSTSIGISYALLMFANHKEIQDKLVEEINDILPNNKWPPSYDDIQNLTYMDMCIKESLRIFSAVPLIGRRINKEFKTQSGHTIPKDTDVYIHIFDLHRNPDIYPDPLKYDPERFLPEAVAARHPYAYIPFSAGSRNCIGRRFAMLEMKTVLTAILRKYESIAVDKPEDIVIVNDIVLRMKNGIKIKFSPRI